MRPPECFAAGQLHDACPYLRMLRFTKPSWPSIWASGKSDSNRRPRSGAARRCIEMRASAIADRQHLVEHTGLQVNVRATGHGWCIAQERIRRDLAWSAQGIADLGYLWAAAPTWKVNR